MWCDAETKNPIDNFYVFPDDVKFEKVKQSKDRVYLLEFKSTQQRHFYWMQDPDSTQDEERAKKVHEVLNSSRQPGPGARGRGGRMGPQIQRNPLPRPGA
mmetsp:Transcript_30636/g.22707  ORF Transcript_30636/g.22707 Transcript_30636/m.22707 type:complete len:100 (+) Transcript_30636:182-481(+)